MPTTAPDLPDGAPAVIVYRLLSGDQWDATRVPDHFDSAWIHTGWYTGNPNPEISVTWDGEGAGTATGYDGIAGSGGPTARLEGTVNVDVWVVGDRDRTGGVNPKQYAWQLRTEVERVVRSHPSGPEGEDIETMGVGRTRRVPEPDETDIQHRHRIPVTYTRYQGRQ